MLTVNAKSFISMLSEEKPVVCFYHSKEEDENILKIKDVLKNIKKELTLLPLYEFIRDEDEENEYLCDVMEIAKYPILVMYKDGCFNRYKAKEFSEKEILKFLGNKTIYMPKELKKVEVDVL